MKMKKMLVVAVAVVLIASVFTGCNANNAKKDFKSANIMVKAYRNLSTDPFNKSYGIGAKAFMDKYAGSKVEFAVGGGGGNGNDLVAAVNSGSPWEVQMTIGPAMPGLFVNNLFDPITPYVDVKDPVFTPNYMKEASLMGVNYGASNSIMSDFFYCVYNESLFKDFNIKTPAEYYAENAWNRESFLKMVDDLQKAQLKIALNFDKPSQGSPYWVSFDEKGLATTLLGTKDNRDYLEFFKTLVYDKQVPGTKGVGFVSKREAAFKLDILPHILINETGKSQDVIRYASMPIKVGSSYAVDYHFSFPKGSKQKEASGELVKMMVKACYDDRIAMYKQGMTPEDFKQFEKEALNSYYVVRAAGSGIPKLTESIQKGTPISQLISENADADKAAVEKYNADVQKRLDANKK